MLNKDKHFNTEHEKNKTNVLYQIEKLIQKYPNTILIDDIITNINKDLKDK